MAYQSPDYVKQEKAAGDNSEAASVVILPVLVLCVLALLMKCEP